MSHCRVHLLDESDIEIGVDLHANGRELLESVCKYLNIIELDYFGLKYKGNNYDGIWIQPDKPIKKQFPIHPTKWEFIFAVQYYPTDPVYLKEEITKYQLCLQIRDDLMNGRLQCPLDTLVTLSSYWLQSEFGDEDEQSDEVKRYLGSLKYIPGAERPTPEFEEKVEKLYKSRRGMPPGDADTQFLRLASSLPFYGLHRYETEAKEADVPLTVAVGSSGIYELRDTPKPTKYKWNKIKNINYKKETFYIKILSRNKNEHSKKLVYHLKSPLFAKAMWREAVGQHVFFRVTCSDTSSAGRTPISTPQVRKNKEITKRKRKLSFRLSFRKKRPKTEAEVREESSRISRPNPTVVRNSSLKRSSSTKSEPSAKSVSAESSSSSEKEDDASPDSTPIKSILKSHKIVEGASEENQDEENGRPFSNEDFEDSPDSDHAVSSNNLLLNEIILEEDEDAESLEEKSIASKKSPVITPTSASFPEEFQTNSEVEVIVSPAEEPPKKEIEFPTVTVEVWDEPRKLSVDKHTGPNRSEFLPPPLVSQSTRDAIIPYYQEEKIATEDPDISEIAEEMLEANYVQEHSKGKIANEEVTPDSPEEEKTPSEKSKASTDLGLPQNGIGKVEDDEDDRRTIGAASAVAVLGDDEEANMKDLVDDIIGEYRNYNKEKFHALDVDQDDDDSRITESSESSISNLTDNTEELCNPNILEIIWSKCSSEKDYGYREIFGVKLRKISGRLRSYHSTMLDTETQVSVGTQVPTPPPVDDSTETPVQSSKFSLPSHGKKFIPSWPFDPNSLAATAELDELDKEAIKAALKAQQELERDLDKMTSDLTLEHHLKSSATKFTDPEMDSTKDLHIVTNKESKSFKRDSIPGIQYFHQSILQSSESSKSSSRRSSHKSTDTSRVQIENLVYPPDIQTYQAPFQHDRDVLKYEPESCRLNQAETEPKLTTTSNTDEIIQDKTYTLKDSYVEPSILLDSSERSNAHKVEDSVYSDHWMPSRLIDSGRSTPSSISSFPQFVHSVYPLRKMSTNWGSESTMSQQDTISDKMEEIASSNESSESSTTLSNCSIKSVRGSSDELVEEEIDQNNIKAQIVIVSPSTEINLALGKPSVSFNKDATALDLLGLIEYNYSTPHTPPSTMLGCAAVAMPDSKEGSEKDSSSKDQTSSHDEELPNDTTSQEGGEVSSSIPYQNLDESSESSSESIGSNSSSEESCEDLSIDLSELIPNSELRNIPEKSLENGLFEERETVVQMEDAHETDRSAGSSDSSSSSSSEEQSDSEDTDDDNQETERAETSFLHEAPTIVISTERSESEKTNTEDSTSVSTNSQDTVEYDIYQSLEADMEQQVEASSQTEPKDDASDATEKI